MTYAVAALLGCGLVRLSVLSWRDYQRWQHPNGHPSEFGDMTKEQLGRSERCQRQIASMDRGAQRS